MKRLNRVYYICFLIQSVENAYMEYPIWEGTLAALAAPTLLGVSRRKMIKTHPVTFSGVSIDANLHLEDTLRLLLLLLVACPAPICPICGIGLTGVICLPIPPLSPCTHIQYTNAHRRWIETGLRKTMYFLKFPKPPLC